ncbi:hypothetical protein G3I76_29780, partial [Streptomyces sp. SID11233]|nr:hypothetical protein [Streptomyces sp. SID11233]
MTGNTHTHTDVDSHTQRNTHTDTHADTDTHTDTKGADAERLRRWRMVLGADSAESTGHTLTARDAAMDGALTA